MNWLRGEKGLTLIELLAGMTLTAIIMLMIFNVLISIQEQYSNQSAEAKQLFDVTYAAKIITKKMRTTEVEEVSESHSAIKFSDGTEFVYNSSDRSIVNEKNTTIATNIDRFYVEMKNDENGNQSVVLIIESPQKTVETEIVIRGGE